jgi:hypothetical protein
MPEDSSAPRRRSRRTEIEKGAFVRIVEVEIHKCQFLFTKRIVWNLFQQPLEGISKDHPSFVIGRDTLRQRSEEEALALTEIRNTFMIRHTETNKIPVILSEHVDYLFHRMFALVRLLLRTSGRGA